MALFALPAVTFAQTPTPPSPEARAAWGFERSDLTPDPRIRFGLLANGMRYAILRNAGHRRAVSFRMLVGVGASMGGPGEAHYLEHVLFQGSRRVPEGASRRLEREGLTIGSDFNAHTGDTDTIFRIDLRDGDRARTDRILLLLRDMASEADFSPEAVERARAEILREARDDPIERDKVAFFLPGTALAGAALRGTEGNVAAVDSEALRAFYARHYLPGQIVLIVVGDVDPAWLERRIEAQFRDWPARAAPEERAPERVDPERPTAFRYLRARGEATMVTIASVVPRETGDRTARRDLGFLQSIAADMLESRITGYRGNDRPFMHAVAYVQDFYRTARAAQLVLVPFDGDWQAALETAERELRRALLHGFTQAELDIALVRERARLNDLGAEGTSPVIANRIAALVSEGIVPTAPGNPADVHAYLARVRLDEVNAAFRAAGAAPGRLIHVAHAGAIEGGEARLAEIWEASAARPVAR